MHLLKKGISLFTIFLLGIGAYNCSAQNYPTPKEINRHFENLATSYSAKVKIHQLTFSPGGNQIILAEIGTEINTKEKKNPALFIVANTEGINPLSSYAAVKLSELILKDEKNLNFTWYILPCLNPDAYTHFFEKVKWENPRNDQKINDDQDDAFDEDGPDDLNNDGYITQMRVRDPQGIWITNETDSPLMRKADPLKGEKGIYTLYPEGIDNDNDGDYNEDPGGGTNTGINFPHLFHSFTATGGLWPGSTAEVFSVLKFIYSHPEIAATFAFGSTNFCLVPPEGGRRGSVDFNNIKIPDEFIEMLKAEKGQSYTMDEIIEMAKPMAPPGIELTPFMVASFLGLGAVVNPLQEDLSWYKELSDQYMEYLKKAKYETDRLDPEKAKDGSFELWVYYQLGLPSFSMNFFTLPKPKGEKREGSGISLEKLGTMSVDEFIALGEEKIAAFLKENNAPEQYNAKSVIEMIKSGQTNPKQMAEMMKNMPKPKKTGEVDPTLKALLSFSDKSLGGKGYLNWQAYKHPVFGDVEIGGAIPFTFSTPPFAWADSLVNIQLPWIFNVADKLPQLKISQYKVKNLGTNVYSIELWIENTKFLPFPTFMGSRNNNPTPCVLTLESESMEFLTGKKRTSIQSVAGLKSNKLTFVVRLNKGNSIKAKLESKFAGNDFLEIKL